MYETIVVVEDDRQIRRVVEGYLQQAGYTVRCAADGATGIQLVQESKPALLILDLMLPLLDGWAVTRRLRADADPAVAGIYIIMLTARVEEPDRVLGLELGADDYVIKPFSPRELVARVQAALRRLEGKASTPPPPRLQAADLQLEPTYRSVTLAGLPVELTSTEFELLYTLMRNPGRPFRRDQLLDALQSTVEPALDMDPAYERTIDAHIKNLRQKLGEAGRNSRFIETVHGVGYRFGTPVVHHAR